jgi:hypothetical protein
MIRHLFVKHFLFGHSKLGPEGQISPARGGIAAKDDEPFWSVGVLGE